ncbi:hypothetical protein [Streptomyces sp. H34-S4]|uniref:hypothetical protein n=1 Tax=Streptomyces sp. H34-S4 TaxID=2996463 RepID=UPI0022714D77|nr:hypothetical protein [Streptomyces sp. H34-S4]MCY0939551.1 hypothetical protein [Streptomyces sp. H34-S4]
MFEMRIAEGLPGQLVWHALHPVMDGQALCGRLLEIGKYSAREAYCEECLVLVEHAMTERADLSSVRARASGPAIGEGSASGRPLADGC